MTGPIPVEIAREQLRELISILGELRNAGPRDQRFKQWRQITVTLLQRFWPADPSRAERFRRIAFSAPTSRSDRRATREYFERGWKEASAYLVGLALELGCVVEPLGEATTTYDDEPVPSMGEEDVVDLPHDDVAGGEDTPDEMNSPDAPFPGEEPPPPSMPEPPEARKAVTGPRPRLKDMLGFTDEAAPDHTRARTQPEFTPTPAPVSFVPLTPTPLKDESPRPSRPVAAPPPSVEPSPSLRVEPSPPQRVESPPQRVESPPPVRAESLPAPSPEADAPDARRDLAAEFVLESAVLQSRARSTREPEAASVPTTPTPSARDVMTLAGRVEEFGVPARECAIVRAALIDLARQMESPPIHWGALRDTVSFAMDHPDLARRVLPLVLPYLDRAA